MGVLLGDFMASCGGKCMDQPIWLGIFSGVMMHNQVEVSSEIVKHIVKGDSECREWRLLYYG